MNTPHFSLGLDFGTESARALLVDVCLPDPNIVESKEELELKVEYLNLIDAERLRG